MHLPKFGSRPLIGAAAVSCAALLAPVVALAATLSPASHGGHAPAITPACATPGLVVWLDTQSNGWAGGLGYNLEFTNLSGHECTLSGYPGVSGVNLGGHRLGSAATHDGGKVSIVSLANGGTTTAFLGIVDVGNFPRASCEQTTAAGLMVYPPGQTTSKVAPFPFGACSRIGPSYLEVQPVGTNGLS
jgi:hypothetical protein